MSVTTNFGSEVDQYGVFVHCSRFVGERDEHHDACVAELIARWRAQLPFRINWGEPKCS